jgi:hypothetical protein
MKLFLEMDLQATEFPTAGQDISKGDPVCIDDNGNVFVDTSAARRNACPSCGNPWACPCYSCHGTDDGAPSWVLVLGTGNARCLKCGSETSTKLLWSV